MKKRHSFFVIPVIILMLISCGKDPQHVPDNFPETTELYDTEIGKYVLLTQTTGQKWLFLLLSNNTACTASDLPEAQFIASEQYKGDLIVPKEFTYDSITYTVTKIGVRSFMRCLDLTSIVIPNTVDTIDAEAFLGCTKIKSLQLPDSLKYIGTLAFSATGITTLSFTHNYDIDEFAFSSCPNLESVTLPEGMITIPPFMFSNCVKLTTVHIPQSVKVIKQFAFEKTAITSITLPDSLTSIEFKAFAESNLTEIAFPNTLKHLCGFYRCKGLTKITIPASVTDIGSSAFQYCSNLREVTSLATEPPHFPDLSSNAFNGTNLEVIYVPSESVYRYQHNFGWYDFADIIQPIP